jgi:hypothetical protein
LHVDEQIEVAVGGRGVAGDRSEHPRVGDAVFVSDGLDLLTVSAQLGQPNSPPGRIVRRHR